MKIYTISKQNTIINNVFQTLDK